MKYLVVALAALSLTACSKERADVRYKIFNNCMYMAGKIQRQGDDDVSDIVKECGRQADNMVAWNVPEIQ